MDSITDICLVKSFQKATKANYQLPFELSKQQQYASETIVQAIKIIMTSCYMPSQEQGKLK